MHTPPLAPVLSKLHYLGGGCQGNYLRGIGKGFYIPPWGGGGKYTDKARLSVYCDRIHRNVV
jgi:hypothetical protein